MVLLQIHFGGAGIHACRKSLGDFDMCVSLLLHAAMMPRGLIIAALPKLPAEVPLELTMHIRDCLRGVLGLDPGPALRSSEGGTMT